MMENHGGNIAGSCSNRDSGTDHVSSFDDSVPQDASETCGREQQGNTGEPGEQEGEERNCQIVWATIAGGVPINFGKLRASITDNR